MYVCIELALGGLPMESGQWEGPIGIVGTISQSRGTIETASLTQVCTNTKSVSGPVCYCTSYMRKQDTLSCHTSAEV